MKPDLLLPTGPLPEGGVPALASALRRMRVVHVPVRAVVRPVEAGVAQVGWRRTLAAAACLLLLAATGGTWLHQRMAATRAELDAASVRLTLAEARHAEAERRAREAVLALREARAALTGVQVRAQEEGARPEEAGKLGPAGEAEALRTAVSPAGPGGRGRHGAGPAPAPEPGFQRVFARVRGAVLYIRASYRIRVVDSGEERELTAYGTGFLVSPEGLALTAQHVVYPWRYDRRLQVSVAAGLVEVLEDSLVLTAWPAERRVTEDGGDEAAFLPGEGYRGGAGFGSVRILHAGTVETTSDLVLSPLGPVEVVLPRVGPGDVAVLQLTDSARRFAHVPLVPTPALAPLDEVLVVGYPLSRLQAGRAVPQGSLGRVRRAGGPVLELHGALHPGNSGGPVVDGAGRVVGMASAILDSPVYGIALHAAELREALAAARTAITAEQHRLRDAGCDPGPADGVPGPRTLAARTCAQGLAAGL